MPPRPRQRAAQLSVDQSERKYDEPAYRPRYPPGGTGYGADYAHGEQPARTDDRAEAH